MNLPGVDRAQVDRDKITDYLLAIDHPEGSSKAEFFARFGFTIADWQVLAEALIAHARRNPISEMSESPYGTKYQLDGSIACPDGRTPSIRVVWIIDTGTEIPRLVTAYPL